MNHGGVRLLCDLADGLGLTGALSAAAAPVTGRGFRHDRGRVLVDLAVMLADGGRCLSDLSVLGTQEELFGPVASVPTAWRVVQTIDAAGLEAIDRARAETRCRVWEAGADPGFYVLDLDATLVGAHSDKEGAAPTYKRGYGFHPLLCYLDGTGEALAGVLRPGNAGSGTAADHVTVLDRALLASSRSLNAAGPETASRSSPGATRRRVHTISSTPAAAVGSVSRWGSPSLSRRPKPLLVSPTWIGPQPFRLTGPKNAKAPKSPR